MTGHGDVIACLAAVGLSPVVDGVVPHGPQHPTSGSPVAHQGVSVGGDRVEAASSGA